MALLWLAITRLMKILKNQGNAIILRMNVYFCSYVACLFLHFNISNVRKYAAVSLLHFRLRHDPAF